MFGSAVAEIDFIEIHFDKKKWVECEVERYFYQFMLFG